MLSEVSLLVGVRKFGEKNYNTIEMSRNQIFLIA